jgi:hypothetical protein
MASDRGAAAVVGAVVRDRLVVVRRSAPAVAALLTLLVVHAALLPHLTIQGAAPDVLLVAVVAVASVRGARAGAAFGFAAGLGADLFLTTPLGTSALAYTLVGHIVGRTAPRPGGGAIAAALCSPTSSCFTCRTGGGQPAGSRMDTGPIAAGAGAGEADGRLARRRIQRRRRGAARRAAAQRCMLLTFVAVAGGHLGTAVVATGLGGVPFPPIGGLVRIGAIALLSAPLGAPGVAALRRWRPARVAPPAAHPPASQPWAAPRSLAGQSAAHPPARQPWAAHPPAARPSAAHP